MTCNTMENQGYFGYNLVWHIIQNGMGVFKLS